MTRDFAVTLITHFVEALNAGDMAALAGTLGEDVVHDLGGGEREFGRDAFREFALRRQAATEEQLGDTAIMVSEDGTRAAIEFTRRGRIRDGGQAGESYSVAGGIFMTLEDGVITRVTPCGSFAPPPS